MTQPIQDQGLTGAAFAAAEAAASISNPAAAPVPPANPYGLTAWGAQFLRREFDIVCPSGQRCRARELQIEDAMSMGILESLDMFTPAVMENVAGEANTKQQNDSILGGLADPEKRASFFGTVNKVIAHTVVIPRVVLVDDGNLPEGTIFANDIPFADKMHIFRSVFGTRGDALQSFREGEETAVASLEEESGVPLSTE